MSVLSNYQTVEVSAIYNSLLNEPYGQSNIYTYFFILFNFFHKGGGKLNRIQ